MSLKSVDTDVGRLTITWVAEFEAPPEIVWQLWANPRLLERWMGPPTYPATVKAFDLSPGGQVEYVLTGPDGGEFGGTWTITSQEPLVSLEYVDGDEDFGTGMPVVTWNMRLAEESGRTRMEVRSRFRSREDMHTMIDMGTVEGHATTFGQMDSLLDQLAGGLLHVSGETGRT